MTIINSPFDNVKGNSLLKFDIALEMRCTFFTFLLRILYIELEAIRADVPFYHALLPITNLSPYGLFHVNTKFRNCFDIMFLRRV